MKAVFIRSFGGPENLEIRDVPEPDRPDEKNVVVRVHAAGLNRADLVQRRGYYPPPEGYSPNIPGLEFAGVITETGPEVSGYSIGDRVFGITAGEAQAEFLTISSRLLARIPEILTFTEAAAIPEVFITAHDAILTQAELKQGETLLVHAVGSGVGLAAVQIAKAIGAKTIGTSRTAAKLERAREFGLDEAILASESAGFADILKRKNGGGVDVVLNLVGAAYFQDDLECLSPKGRLMLVGLTSGSKVEFDLSAALTKRLKIIGTTLRGRSIEEKADATSQFTKDILPRLAAGTMVPVIDKVFPIDEVSSAHEYLESNKSFGKVVLQI